MGGQQLNYRFISLRLKVENIIHIVPIFLEVNKLMKIWKKGPHLN